jgi:glycosyltransferase involved in cell wall biosynthesis
MCPIDEPRSRAGHNVPGQSPEVTVLIATLAVTSRTGTLRRAIRSAFEQEPSPHLIVVVNGGRYDQTLLAELRNDPRIQLRFSEVPSYPAAQRLGRLQVLTPYFCFLDDDDVLLPGSISARLARARQSDAPDVVVSNGYRSDSSEDVPSLPIPAPGPHSDLLISLLQRNWFASCAPLFRSARVDESFFDGQTKYFEWTLLAFRLLLANRSFAFVPQFGFRVSDSPGSLSKDERGTFAEPSLLQGMLQMNPPANVRWLLKQRLAIANHACSDLAIRQGALASAWQHHLRSMIYPGGLRYLTYTRHLIAAAFGSTFVE